jgi:hypothetical protein
MRLRLQLADTFCPAVEYRQNFVRFFWQNRRHHRDRPEIRGIMTIGIGSVRYAPGWGLTDGMDAVFGWDGD